MIESALIRFLERIGAVTPEAKVLDFLLNSRGSFDYSLTDIAEGSGISWATMNSLYPKLLKSGIIKHTRTISRAKLFTLNLKNPVVQELVHFDSMISKQSFEKEEKRAREQTRISLGA